MIFGDFNISLSPNLFGNYFIYIISEFCEFKLSSIKLFYFY